MDRKDMTAARKRGVLRLIGAILAQLVALLTANSLANAQALRTWVSGTGNDLNPCALTAPCKTLAAAFLNTAVGGEIDVLDSGGFGSVVVTHSISIEAVGTLAGVLVSGTNGIKVLAGPNDIVVIRGLTIEGIGNPSAQQGLNGIQLLSGGELHVENCTINDFAQKGIDFNPSTPANLFVKDTMIRNNNNPATGGGIYIHPQSGATARGSIDHVRLENNLFGLRAEDGSKVAVSNTVASMNLHNGFISVSNGGPVELNLESVVAHGNGTNGAQVQGAAAVLRLSNCLITDNAAMGVTNISGAAKAISFGNNRINGNVGGDGPVNNIGQN